MIRLLTLSLLIILSPALATAQTPATNEQVIVHDLDIGEGNVAVDGARVVVQYVGYLLDGTKFDSSYDRGLPFSFTLGLGEVIRGWELGVRGMRVGGRRELVIPPSLAYGEKGGGTTIPPGATLRFEIELMKADAPTFSTISAEDLKAAMASVILIDIRPDGERARQGTIKGAIHLIAYDQTGKLNRKFMVELLKVAQKTDTIILLDNDGRRAHDLGAFLAQNAGFKDLHSLDGGLSGWAKRGYPLIP